MTFRQTIGVGRTNAAILDGEDDLSDWDDEELMRGRRRADDGTFRGGPPTVVPKSLHDELCRRKFQEAYATLYERLAEVSARAARIALGEETATAAEMKAIEQVFDRTLGKPTERVNVTSQEEPWMAAIRQVVVVPEEDDDVIDVEAVEEDEQLWDEDDEIIWDDEPPPSATEVRPEPADDEPEPATVSPLRPPRHWR